MDRCRVMESRIDFTHIYIYIYIYVCVCVCMYVCCMYDSIAVNLAPYHNIHIWVPFQLFTVCMVSKCNFSFKYDQNYRFTHVKIISQIYNIDMMLALFVNKQC